MGKTAPYFCFLVSTIFLSLPATAQIGRFALVVGNNRGAERDKTLRYAERDAKRVKTLLTDLAGVPDENTLLLQGENSERLYAALAQLENSIRNQVPRRYAKALVIIYFSGHADGDYLELGTDRVRFDAFREKTEQLSADIKIVVVDSCQSGRLTGYKGGRAGPAFDLTLTDTVDADGMAILTSSAAGEKSQESSEIQGSFFTHFFLSGLKGDADLNQDQKVTLPEIYQYTYAKTVAKTARTTAGMQHPSYEYRITGRGNVVLTDLAQGETHLVFGPETSGTFFVIAKNTEEVAAEIGKEKGTWRAVALKSGDYLIAERQGNVVRTKTVFMEEGKQTRFYATNMDMTSASNQIIGKGGKRRPGIALGAYYGLAGGILKNYAMMHEFLIGLRADAGPISIFPRFTFGYANVKDAALNYRILLFGGESTIAWRLEYSLLDLFLGVGLGLGRGQQKTEEGTRQSGIIFTYTAVAGVDIPLMRRLSVSLFWEGGAQLFRGDGRLRQHPALRGSLGVNYVF